MSQLPKKRSKIKTIQEFKEFLKEYHVVSVAVAFMMGTAINELIKSFVNNVLMPLIDFLIPGGEWQNAVWQMGSVPLNWGAFLSELIHFLILALVVFLVVKKIFSKLKKASVKIGLGKT
ncbi:MAG: hypothetical protein A2233_04100 [Candidatus Kerfeldbacteria bacterium RIFOXYA2_FULL_38_24]|uniref:Mechanosensitive ion channel protein MscL n=1 Tax=Candidatus Kerfeldbacteria bacterium RIFOXYB2_FULL_38_14 TaxID=1798547 RepID=A0A1G2BES4_9BACT|nr:MAG: hypothetical protein A2233_04100 [Candidatus Kerfeldbacteria bacterium RIFOXYA2_FULL_38_24]OGY86750.1 MAG: hypothetical protein A2319_00835 [Candidatus Kerfeldbacteria bacterium RIFOXYB2_FULL_38_14]OGY89034.1 MAG: hypothetical protein A2458_05405 [Candidatus Kerfeldbacteria bacterium RIFOXYC2_FULL_38_9]